MAARRKGTRVSTGKGNDVVVVNAPAPLAKRRAPRRRAPRKKTTRRRRSSGGTSDLFTRNELWTLGGAALLGYMQRTNVQIPKVFNLTPEASAGIIAWALGKWGNVKVARDVAPGMLAIAVHRYAAGTVPEGFVIGEDGMVYFDEYEDDDEDDEDDEDDDF